MDGIASLRKNLREMVEADGWRAREDSQKEACARERESNDMRDWDSERGRRERLDREREIDR